MRVQFVAAAHGAAIRLRAAALERRIGEQPARGLRDLQRVPVGVRADGRRAGQRHPAARGGAGHALASPRRRPSRHRASARRADSCATTTRWPVRTATSRSTWLAACRNRQYSMCVRVSSAVRPYSAKMSATIWRCIFQIRYRSGSTVSMPNGPGGSASEPDSTAAWRAASRAIARRLAVGVATVCVRGARHVGDHALDRAFDVARRVVAYGGSVLAPAWPSLLRMGRTRPQFYYRLRPRGRQCGPMAAAAGPVGALQSTFGRPFRRAMASPAGCTSSVSSSGSAACSSRTWPCVPRCGLGAATAAAAAGGDAGAVHRVCRRVAVVAIIGERRRDAACSSAGSRRSTGRSCDDRRSAS